MKDSYDFSKSVKNPYQRKPKERSKAARRRKTKSQSRTAR